MNYWSRYDTGSLSRTCLLGLENDSGSTALEPTELARRYPLTLPGQKS
jgi:hypothetical protein